MFKYKIHLVVVKVLISNKLFSKLIEYDVPPSNCHKYFSFSVLSMINIVLDVNVGFGGSILDAIKITCLVNNRFKQCSSCI